MLLNWARVACGVLAACLCCARTRAQHSTAQDLAWLSVESAGDPCIEGPELVQEVLRLLGSETPPAGVEVHVQAFEDRVRFRLEQGSGDETTRELTDLPRQCAARREAVSLVLALAIEHALAEEHRRRAENPLEPPAELAPAAHPPPSEPRPTGAEDSRESTQQTPDEPLEPSSSGTTLGGQVRVLGGLNAGLLPRPAAEGRLEGELSVGARWAIVLAAVLSSATEAPLSDGRLQARAVGSSLGVCLGGTTGPGRLHGCLDLGLGAVLGSGHDLARNRRDTTASGTLELGLLGRWPLSEKLGLVWRLGVVGQWLRPRYETLLEGTNGQDEVADTTTFPAFGGRALVGMSWKIR